MATSRKALNLRLDPAIALVIGGTRDGDERTVQYEGTADEPSGAELEPLLALYYARFPDGPARRSWPGLVYVRVKPFWIRYSDFGAQPPEIVEFDPGSGPESEKFKVQSWKVSGKYAVQL